MAELRERRNSNSQLLLELDTLSQTLYQSHSNRRTASLALPRSAIPSVNAVPTTTTDSRVPVAASVVSDHRPRSRRLSMSPFRSRTKSHLQSDEDEEDGNHHSLSNTKAHSVAAATQEKKGIWGWKPLRALAHIRMQKISCLFSAEVVCIQGLPASMNGLRLSVAVRKKETKEGAVQTMPSRVLQGCADFEETLFIKCHVYCSGKPPKFEPHPFIIKALAIDASELDFGKSAVDLSLMVKESMDRNMEGERIRQWDSAFSLSGKAKGGELVVKLGFQIMEDGGVEIYNQYNKKGGNSSSSSSAVARNQSKSSFSVSSPKITRLVSPMTPSKEMASADLRAIDDFTLDEPAPPPPPPSVQKDEPEQKQDDLDLPDFEVIDKGVELQEEEQGKEQEEVVQKAEAEAESNADEASVISEVVKEVVHDSAHQTRLTELDAIAQQIKALESMVTLGDEMTDQNQQEEENQQLDADEETVTREFLQMLELEGDKNFSFDMPEFSIPDKAEDEKAANSESKCYLSDLGKGLGSIVQTRDGGYLAAMNPFDTEVSRKETPKLTMQISKPVIIDDQGSGIEVFQKLASLGSEGLASKLALLASMDELMNKTAEQIAFEGIASAIISGRSKEGASSSAAKSVAALKSMASAMTDGRKERISTGIWNVKEEPMTVEEVLPFSLQKIEVMATEALKIQAQMSEEEAPFDVSPLHGKESPLDSTIQPEDCAKLATITMLVVVQIRDPLRRYDTVGAPMIALIQATKVDEAMFKVTNLHVGGVKVKSGEKEKLKAVQWLVAYGLGKARKKGKTSEKGKEDELIWSISSRVMADMWMKAMRNPNVKFAEKL